MTLKNCSVSLFCGFGFLEKSCNNWLNMFFVGVNTDEVDSHEDWDEVTVELLIDEEEIIIQDDKE